MIMIKKLYILAVILSFTCQYTTAQDRAGFYAGGNLANLSGDADGNSKFGLMLGISFGELELADRFYLEPDLQYSQQGLLDGGNIVSGDVLNGKTKLDYINLAGNFKYDTYLFKLYAGPQVGYLINAIRENDEGDETDLIDDVSKFEYGVNLGAEFCPAGTLFLRLEYNLGLSNIYDDSIEGFNDEEINNSVFSFCIGLRFD